MSQSRDRPASHRDDMFSGGHAPRSDPRLAYLGDLRSTFAAFAADPAHRRRVSSGGVVTTLLRTALEDGLVDGVVLARGDFSSGGIGHRVDIVREPELIGAYGTSAYFDIPVQRYWKQLGHFDGRLAVCGLPCHTAALRRHQATGREPQNVEFVVSLFCGHNNDKDLISFVLEQHGIDEAQVSDMVVDRTYLAGEIRVTLRDGAVRTIPFRHFNVYRSLWFFSKRACRYCNDHLGTRSDVSVGDIFVEPYRRKATKHSAIVTRTSSGERLVRSLISRGILTADEIKPELIFEAQKRILLPSFDLRSRYLACRLTGFSSKKPKAGTLRARSFMVYTLLNLNDRLSRAPWGLSFLKRVPRPLLYAYLVGIKLMNHSLTPNRHTAEE